MALPIQNTPKHICVLPHSGEEVEYRPFLVKEQKILVLARESENNAEIFGAVKELIGNCTFGKLNVDKLASIDLEFLFLAIRAKSVGETADVTISCQEEECAGSGQATVVLNDVEVVGSVPEDNKIMLNDTTGVTLKMPTVADMNKYSEVQDQGDQGLAILKTCLDTIFDQENVYEVADTDPEELDEFIESLTLGQVETIGRWFEDLPRLQKDVHYQCGLCNKEQSRTLVGLQSFF